MDRLSNSYAHSLPMQPKCKWQRLDVHLRQVASRAAQFATAIQSEDWAWNAGWLHDMGKAAGEFQAYLLRENGLDDRDYDGCGQGNINHSSAGAALADKQYSKITGLTMAFLAAGHHAGLTDYHAANAGRGALVERLQEGAFNLKQIEGAAGEVLNQLKPVSRPPTVVKSPGYHLWLRMLFSCLVDADFLDTEVFMRPEVAAIRAPYAGLPRLKDLFDHYMQEKTDQSPRTPVNIIRAEILATSRAAAIQESGLYSMTVPTGGGKTLSGMAFALDHAVKFKKERIIYVIPYTSIIEQTAKTLSEIFGPENVVEHHSNLEPERETQRSRLAAENWDAPIIVTTNVQFFESLFAAKPGQCRKLHNIVNSVVILDEAQLLPPEWLTPCVETINQLTANYGVTMILSTATQPAPPGLAPVREIVPDAGRLYDSLKRVRIHMPTNLNAPVTWEALAEELKTHERVLCIVNTRKDCHDLYKLLPEGTIHLSALMCGAHRSKVIADIKEQLSMGKPIRVISTQLVEAGVDIDFPVVYRALAGLDSIAQAAGRCNREGKLEDLGDVYVFVPPKDPPRGLLRKGADKTRELMTPDFDPQAPDSFDRYFSLFYAAVNDTGKNWLNEKLVRDVPHIQFRTAAQDFKLIDDQTQQAVVVRYGDSEKWIKQLEAVGPKREIMRHLQRYTVNLPKRMADTWVNDGRLTKLDCDVVVQYLPGVYYDDVGLDIFNGQLPIEDLIQ